VVQIQEASRTDLMIRMIVAAARDHGPAVFVVGSSAEELLIADAIVRHRVPVELVAVGAESDPIRAYLTRLYGLDDGRIRTADSLKRALFGKLARITARRGSAGGPVPAYEYDADHGMLRFNPLTEWSDGDLRAALEAAGVEHFEPSSRAPATQRAQAYSLAA
jgi:hypothetical protein